MENNIRKIRKENKMTQLQLSLKLNTSQANLCAWEKGKWEPDFETVKRICSIFNCSADYLIGITNYEVAPTKTELIEQITEEQQTLTEKIKTLDEFQCKRLLLYIDKMLKDDKEEEETVKRLYSQYHNQNKSIDN